MEKSRHLPQSFSDLTEEELNLLSMKKVVTRETDTSIIDQTTGEILKQNHSQSFVVEREPDYIKLYYSTYLIFNGINDIPVNFVMAISSFITWAGSNSQMRFVSSAPTIDSICSMLNIKKSMYSKYLKRCVESGLLIPSDDYRGCYDVNPYFVARGKWDAIKELRTTFDFKQGRWLATRTYGDNTKSLPQSEEEIEP